MEKPTKFLLPSPKFDKLQPKKSAAVTTPYPHFLTPQGMLLPREMQPPPMYGPRGATIPAKFLDKIHQTDQEPQQQKPKERIFCNPCEMDFQSAEDYRAHCSEHQRCEIDDCSFRGHPTIMDHHIVKLHSSGLSEQIKKLNSPEEIAQWREERKKKYPTVANVLMRQKVQEQRNKRGERLEGNKSRFGRRGDRRQIKSGKTQHQQNENDERCDKNNGTPNTTNNKRHQRKRRRNTQGNKCKNESSNTITQTAKRPLMESTTLVEEEDSDSEDLEMFRGTSTLYPKIKIKKEKSHNPLSSLLGMYGSDNSENSDCSEEDDSEDTEEETEIAESVNLDDAQTKDKALVQNIQPVNNLETKRPTCNVENEKERDSLRICSSTENTTANPVPNMQNSFEETLSPKNHSEAYPTDDDDEAPDESSIEKSSNHQDKPQPKIYLVPNVRNSFEESSSLKNHSETDDDDEAPEESAIEKSTNYQDKRQSKIPPQKQPKVEKFKPKKAIRRSGLDYRKLRAYRPNTMLEKLLEPDIRHERNVLLQCVRFVCENNFFGIGSSSTSIPLSKPDM